MGRRRCTLRFGAAAVALGVQLAAADVPPVRAEIEVRLEPATRELIGHGTWRVPSGRAWSVTLDARFTVPRLAVDGEPAATVPSAAGQLLAWPLPAADRERHVEMTWRGRLQPLDPTLDHRAVLTHAAPAAGARGSFLPAAARWHPVFEGAGLVARLRIDVPDSQYAIVPGRLLEERVSGGRRSQAYAFEQPEAAIDLMAGPYRVTEREVTSTDGRRLALRTLYHAEIAGRAEGDLDAVERYLWLYESWIGPYPYESFSVVSSPTPTGFGLPTLAYLGADVLRLPFIRDTSLGHEVLHNWWGHGVRPDHTHGNWSEGLTTFMADYAYRERAGQAAALETRLGWLRDFAALGSAADTSLTDFTARTHGAAQVIGYHKAAMVFLMLREDIGEDAFDRGLRAFWAAWRGRVASWDDLRDAFESASRRDLRAWFEQWLTRTGAPDLRLAAASAARVAGGWQVDVELVQGQPPYRMRVPVLLGFAGGAQETRWVALDRPRERFVLAAGRRPERVVLDPDARVFRRLTPGEAAPILRQAMLDPTTVTVLAGAEAAGESVARRLSEHALKLHPATRPPPPAPLLLVGRDSDVERYLARHGWPPRPHELLASGGPASAWAWTAERPGGAPLTVVAARDEASLAAIARPLPHYGRQSWLVFEGSRVLARGIWPSRPQEIRLGGD